MPNQTEPTKEPYPSDLNDAEWALLRPLLPGPPRLGRPPRYDRRLVLNAIFYVVRSGCAWRLLPHDLPHWRLCDYYFATWRESGLWQELNAALRDQVRARCGKKAPSAAIFDAQSVKVANLRAEAASHTWGAALGNEATHERTASCGKG